MMPLFRSALFNLGAAILAFGIGIVLLALLVSRRGSGRAGRFWAGRVLWWPRVTVGLTARLTGGEKLPPGAAVLAAWHQSACGTVFWLTLDPQSAYVLKANCCGPRSMAGSPRAAG